MPATLVVHRGGCDATKADLASVLGVRNSYDRSLAVGLTLGSRVFCCDNLAFSGEVTMHRKHTLNVFRDLPDLIYRMLSQVARSEEHTPELQQLAYLVC